MTHDILPEPVEVFVAHIPVSRALPENPLLFRWIGQSCEDMWPAATRTVEAMAEYPGSQEPNQIGSRIPNNTADSIFVAISKASATFGQWDEFLPIATRSEHFTCC